MIILLISPSEDICYECSLEVPWRGASNQYQQHLFLWRNKEKCPGIIIECVSLTAPLTKTKYNLADLKPFINYKIPMLYLIHEVPNKKCLNL